MIGFSNIINAAEEIDGEKVEQVVERVIRIFATEKISYSSACYILDKTKDIMADYSVVQSLDRR